MKFLIKTIAIIITVYVVQLFLPFWGVALAAFTVSMFVNTNGYFSFLAGFLGAFLVWGLSTYLIDINSLSTLTGRMSDMLSLSPILFILITAVIGGFLGGFGSLCGTMLINLTKKKKTGYY